MHAPRKPIPSMLALATSALLVVAGACSDRQSLTGVQAPSDRASAAIGTDVAFGALDYNLTSFDIATSTLSATINLLPPNPILPPNPVLPPNPIRAFSATFTLGTDFRLARLDAYGEGNQTCADLASDYNANVATSAVNSDGSLLYASIGQLAEHHCNARVLVDFQTATIRSFQPVP